VLQPEISEENDFMTVDPPVIIVIASSNNIKKYFDHLDGPISNDTDITWILLPTDSILEDIGTLLLLRVREAFCPRRRPHSLIQLILINYIYKEINIYKEIK